jgi:Rrf2 family protein
MVNKQFANAVHLMTSLALLKQKSSSVDKLSSKTISPAQMNSEQLAESANTNPVVIRRLICSLSRAGLIQTSRGKSGGVSLAKDPSDITLNDIYSALELSDAISHHEKPTHKECPISCATHQMILSISEGAEKALEKYLQSQKLSDLIKKIKN